MELRKVTATIRGAVLEKVERQLHGNGGIVEPM